MRLRALAAVALAACALVAGAGDRAAAHGNLDQQNVGGAGCHPVEFTHAQAGSGGMRQEFVPTGTGLSSVGVCVVADAPGTLLTLTIREGTIDAIGSAIGGLGNLAAPTTVDGAGPDEDFTHSDFPAVIAVNAGQSYVIQVDATGPITWYGNPSGGPYPYAGGSSNAGAGVDLAFRTYLGVAAPPAATNTATAIATATRTRTPTRTPTATASVTGVPTLPAVATNTPLPPPPGEPTLPPPPPPPAATARAAASATRTSGVLAQTRTGIIRLPDVGVGNSTRDPAAVLAFALAAAGAVTAAAGIGMRARRRG